jgi:transcriptional regulator with XRE-family HTH domain
MSIDLRKIRDRANEKKMTLKELASGIGITEHGLQRIIKENTTKIDTLEKISNLLDVPISYFFTSNLTLQEKLSDAVDFNAYIIKYLKKIEDLKMSGLSPGETGIKIKRYEYIKKHIIEVSQIELIIKTIEDIELVLQNYPEETSINYLNEYFQGSFPVPSYFIVKEIIDQDLIQNIHLKNYLKQILINQKG